MMVMIIIIIITIIITGPILGYNVCTAYAYKGIWKIFVKTLLVTLPIVPHNHFLPPQCPHAISTAKSHFFWTAMPIAWW